MKLSLFLITLSASVLCADDWPKFQGPNGIGTSAETGLLKSFPKDGPKILWETELEGGFGGAAIVGDEVFLGDRVQKEKEMLLCLDFATGKEKWRFESSTEGEPPFPGSRSVPTVEDDAVFFLGSYGEVFRINRKTHKADWKIKLEDRYPDATVPKWGYAQCTLIIGDILIVMPFGEETGIAGWNKKTGKEIWRSGGIGNTHSSPTVMTFGGEPHLVLLTTKGLNGYNPTTGEILWQSDIYENRIPISFPVQVDEERFFVSGGYDGGSKMISIKKSDDGYGLKELWKTKKGTQVHPALVIDKHLYFLANENSNYKTSTRRKKGGLVSFDLDGKELWSTGNTPFMGRGASLYADGMLIIQDGESGILRLVDPSPKGYKLLAEANIFDSDLESKKDLQYWSPLALSNGKLIMRGQGKMICLDLKK